MIGLQQSWLGTVGILLWLLLISGCKPLPEGQKVFRSYCAGCHGAQLQGGGLAGPLVKTDWQYGRRKGHLLRTVTFGIAGTEMAAWGKVLSPEKIEAVVNYVLESQTISPAIPGPVPKTLESELYSLRVDVVVNQGLDVPWAIEFVDSSTVLMSERPGQLRWIVDGVLDPQPIHGTPPTLDINTAGYMDIAIDPQFAENGWIYLAHSYTPGDIEDESARAMTRVVRGKVEDHQWHAEEVIFDVPDSLLVQHGTRWGCRFVFDLEGHLFFSIGDMAQGWFAQDLGKPAGKVFRIWPNGSIPADNPFGHSEGSLQAIYTYGNRNVQGMDRHPVTGEIWSSEHGPMGGDELNILMKGANYGWPEITYGIDYDGSKVSDKTEQEGMMQPILQWTPSIAVCPITFVHHPAFARWENNLLVGALAHEEVRRLEIRDREVVKQELILKSLGRVRDIKMGPDGCVYILTNMPDRLIRLSTIAT